MSLATETDAREAVRLMLDDNADNSDYDDAGTQPDTIEVVEASPRKQKHTYQADAIYVWQPADTDTGKMGAAGADRRSTPVVQIEAWTTESDAQAHALKEDVISIVGQYRNDSQTQTAFVDIYPTTVTDLRHEQRVLDGTHYIETVLVQLRRLDAL